MVLEIFRGALDNSPVAITIHGGDDGRTLFCNSKVSSCLGYDDTDLIGVPLIDLPFWNNSQDPITLTNLISGKKDTELSTHFKSKLMNLVKVVIKVQKYEVSGVSYLALSALLLPYTNTGTPRQWLQNQSHNWLSEKEFQAQAEVLLQQKKIPHRLMIFTLSNLKLINNLAGISRGDSYIESALKSIQDNIKHLPIPLKGHWHGNSFFILIEAVQHDDFSVFLEKLGKTINTSFNEISQGKLVSIILGASEEGYHFPTLFQQANDATYQCREELSNTVLYDDDLASKSQIRKLILSGCEPGFDKSKFHYVFQGIYRAFDRTLAGFEMLLRWSGGNKESFPPDLFIPFIEATPAITQLTYNTVEIALHTIKQHDFVQKGLSLSINISSNAMLYDDFDIILDLLKSERAACKVLKFELTERTNYTAQRYHNIIQRILDLGITLSLDDFGTGYGSLVQLKDFPAQEIKIDGRFVKNITTSESDLHFVSQLIEFAHKSNMTVVAEKVETEAQLKILQKLKCNYTQGYLFGPPGELSS